MFRTESDWNDASPTVLATRFGKGGLTNPSEFAYKGFAAALLSVRSTDPTPTESFQSVTELKAAFKAPAPRGG